MDNKYKKVRLNKFETIDEHRLVMEKFLNRKLNFNEIVHHIDGNKSNNEISNLQILTRSEHSKLHYNSNNIPSISETRKNKLRSLYSKVSKEQALRIKYDNEPTETLIKELNISKHVISRIRCNKSWKNI